MDPMTPTASRSVRRRRLAECWRVSRRDAQTPRRRRSRINLPGRGLLRQSLRAAIAFFRASSLPSSSRRARISVEARSRMCAAPAASCATRSEKRPRGRHGRLDLRGARMSVKADHIVRVGRIDVARDPVALHPFAGDVVLVEVAHVVSRSFDIWAGRPHCQRPATFYHIFRTGLAGVRSASFGEIAHEAGPRAERPRRTFVGMAHPIGQPAELIGGDRDDVALLCVNPLPGASRSAIGANIVPRNSTPVEV